MSSTATTKGQPIHVQVVRFFESRPWVGDTLFKVLPLLFVAWVSWWGRSPVTVGMLGQEVIWPVMMALDAIAILPLAISRIRPGLAATITASACVAQLLTASGPGWSVIAVPLMVYACAKYGTRRVSLTFLVVGLAGAVSVGVFIVVINVVLSARDGGIFYDAAAVAFITVLISGFSGAVVLTAWLFGDLSGRRRQEQEAIAEKNQLLERERDQEARLAADAERMRIAREMHDVISHSMSVMIAQADGGRYVMEQSPQQALRAFETISETGRESLTEMRRMLGVLREEDQAAQRRPAPSASDLPRLIQDVRASGLEVELDHRQIPEVSEGVGLALYRITQEALTNTLKHAGPAASATVWLGTDYAAGELVLDIRDNGQGSAAADDGAGSGLAGMSERARLYGGRVFAAPGQQGFTVHARFPLNHDQPVERNTP